MASGLPGDVGPVVPDIRDFDQGSGSFLERLIFNNRPIIVLVCLAITAFLGFQATRLSLNANFEEMIPLHHPFMVNYVAHYDDLRSQGNALRIDVTANQGTILNAKYLNTLQHINDDVFNLPGVDRPFMTSLWTPNTRWITVNAQGLDDGPVIGSGYDGSPAQIQVVATNIANTGQVGSLVSADYKSSMIYVPLMNHNGITGAPINYGELARDLNQLRAKYDSQGVTLHIIGFGMVVGDMILGIKKILAFFAVSLLIATAMLYWYTRCVRSTFMVVSCSLVAVIWQLGLLPLFGFELDPYSVLVPFLIFAIGMSHGAQKMNGVMQDIGRGTHRLVAARYTFRRLFLAGFTALVCDATGFAVLALIRIQAIQELAIIASCGVAILIVTNLILIPISLSYIGVNRKSAKHSLKHEIDSLEGREIHPIWNFFTRFTHRRWAVPAIAVAALLGIMGYFVGLKLQVGDLGNGAPELRANSQYNRDNRFIVSHYVTGSDTLVLMTHTSPYYYSNIKFLAILSDLEWQLDQMPEVQSASSVEDYFTLVTQMLTDNAPKWYQLEPNQPLIKDFVYTTPAGAISLDGDFVPITITLVNHKAQTLQAVIDKIQDFIAKPENQGSQFKFLLAGGNAGIAAATNQVVAAANAHMLIWIYIAVAILCFITFRSVMAVLCAILPLILTSLLCRALMVWLGIGVTVATLPVVALGVGIGVDYALYVLGVVMTLRRTGATLEEAYRGALLFTGRVVLLTGLTLSTGVATWAFAPIKFQADMGVLLAFMFLVNMVGALILLPALASFLLPQVKMAPKIALQDSPLPGTKQTTKIHYVSQP